MVPFRCHKQRLDMTKTELQVALAAATETNKTTAGVFLDTLSNLAYKATKKNGEFVLPGFGKLLKQKRKARTGFNPKTQEKIKIPAKTVVKFRVAKAAKDGVLGGKEVVQGVGLKIPIFLDKLINTLLRRLIWFQPVGWHIWFRWLTCIVAIVFHPDWRAPC